MNETICNVMLFGGIALAIIFAIVAVVLFVKLDIPKVIGDLSEALPESRLKKSGKRDMKAFREAAHRSRMRLRPKIAPERLKFVI